MIKMKTKYVPLVASDQPRQYLYIIGPVHVIEMFLLNARNLGEIGMESE